MISTEDALAPLLGELRQVLDEEIQTLEDRLACLAGMEESLIQRDENRLEALLNEAQTALGDEDRIDRKLRALRGTLAQEMGLSEEQFKLRALLEKLRGPARQELEYRRRQIVLLVGRLRNQHLRTAMMLTEAGRVNRAILRSLFPDNHELTTYGQAGTGSKWNSGEGLLDTER